MTQELDAVQKAVLEYDTYTPRGGYGVTSLETPRYRVWVEITNRLNEARIKLTEQQDKQLEEAIAQKWEEISLHDTEVNIKIAQTIINGIGTIGGLLQASRLAEAMKQAKGKINKKTEKTITGDGKDVWKETTHE